MLNLSYQTKISKNNLMMLTLRIVWVKCVCVTAAGGSHGPAALVQHLLKSKSKRTTLKWFQQKGEFFSFYECRSVNWNWQVFVTELSLLLFGRGSSAKTSVPIILDGKRLSEDDDDDNENKQFVMEEMVPLPAGVPQLDVVIVIPFKY